MAFDERDPRDLKLHVLLLLLEHPQGISFGDFSGAFHQLHGYHPHISLYGYSSLRQLIADMKDLVVVEGSSGTPVMKFIKGLTLDNWPEVENGLQCSAEEPRCLMNGEKAAQQPVGLADVLVALTNLLAEYKSGLRIKKLQEFLLARDGTDLEKFSINHGYKNTLEFLEAQMPELSILYQENQVKCVVQLMADASASSASATIQNSVEEPVSQAPALSDILAAVLKLLAKYKWGLKIKKLQDLLLAEGGVDLEKFSISHGNKDTLEFLEVQMPELNIQYKENHLSCVVMLPTEDLPDILAAVSNLLAKYKLGLKIKTLQELLLARDGIDLKKISNTHGYKDTLEFLEAQMPELHIQYKANRLSCLVQLHTEDLSDTLAAITNILAKYKLGLKIKKLQELLLAEEGIDLEKFSISHGNKGTLQFLEVWMPELNIQYKENHLSCVVQLPADICVSSASSNVQNNGKEPAGQPPVPCIPVPSLESDSSACISNPAPSGHERRKTGTSSPAPCPGTVFPTCNSDAVSQKLTETKSGVTASSAPDDIQNCVELPRRQAPELSVPFFLIRDILQGHPHGLRLKKLKKALNKNYKFNLMTFCSDLGYKDVTSCLQDISGLLVRNITKCKNCVVQLESRACSPAPSLDSDFSTCCSDTRTSRLTRPEFGASSLPPHPDFCAFNADAVPQKPLATSSGLAEVLVALTNLLAAYKSGLRVTKLQEFLLARDGIDLEKFSLSHGYKDTLEFLEAQMTELSIHYREDRLSSVIQLAADASASSASATIQNSVEEPVSQAPGASSLTPRPDFCAFNAGAVPQKPLATSPGLAEVLVALTNLLAAYKSGLRITKLQEFLLARDGIDLEKFSLSHGYKDTLEFLEAQMTELSIHYREDRLSSVIQLAAGCGDNAKPLSTSCHSSASKAQDQSLPLSASPTVDNGVHKYRSVVQPPVLPSFDNPCITSHAKISSSHERLCPGPAQPPKACQLNGPLPPDEVSPQVDVEVPKISNLIKDQPAKDLEELKRQVAHILARHPEGMSLFQFRAAYSATYQQHLPLGNASSAKQCLLKMPDVVQLKGCGVQTLLLPVSLAAPPAKSGQPASSAVEKTPAVPGHTLPPTTAVAKPQMVLRPILSKAPEVPQQSPVSFLPPDHCREPGDQESCLLPRGQPPTATNPWQEHQRARAKAEDISGQPDWSRVEKASVDLAISVPKASLVGAPESRLKPPAPNTAAMPMPQTPLSFLQVSELCRQTNSKECSSFSQPVPQKAPLPVYPMQEYVRTNPKPACNSFPPQSPVVFPTTPTSWDENLKPSSLDPKSTHLTNPWSLSHRTPATLASQPVSAGFQAWSQPVVYPPITFLSEMPAHPVTYPTPFVPTPVHPCQIQVPKSTLRSHPHAQKVTPKRPAQVMPPIHSTAQWTYIPAVPHSNIFQVPETSRTLPPSAVVFPAGWSPLSPPPRYTDASRSPKSQAVHQLACSNQDGLQGFSLPGANEKHLDTTLEGVTSKPPSPMYPRPYNNADPLKTSSSTLPISSLSLSSTKASLEPPYASSGIKKNSNSPLEPPAFLNQQQFTSTSTAPDTSDVRPAGSPPSLLDPTSSPHDQPLHPLSSITSNSDVHFSEPESFNDPQPYTSVSAVGTVSSTPSLSSPLCPVGSPSSPPRQPSSAAWKGGIDYGAPDQKNAMPTIFNQTGSPPGPLSRRQTLPNPSPPVTPPSQSFDKCVIL